MRRRNWLRKVAHLILVCDVLGINAVFSGPSSWTADVTFYCNEGLRGCAKCCGKWAPLNRTASGRRPVPGVSCAAPPGVPFGTWVEIEGVGLRRVDDRLSPKFAHRWDVFESTHKGAIRRGILRNRRISLRRTP